MLNYLVIILVVTFGQETAELIYTADGVTDKRFTTLEECVQALPKAKQDALDNFPGLNKTKWEVKCVVKEDQLVKGK